MELSPYLMFNGTCEEALKFYEQALGAKIENVIKHAGTPAEEHVSEQWREKVMHARFSVDGNVVMASAPRRDIKKSREASRSHSRSTTSQKAKRSSTSCRKAVR